MAKYLRGKLQPAETLPSERERFNHLVLAWEFHEPRQAVWLAEDPEWLAELIEMGNARDARENAPAASVREQLGLPPEPTGTEAQRAATRAKVLAALEAKQAKPA